MADQELIRKAGELLFGPDWTQGVATILGVEDVAEVRLTPEIATTLWLACDERRDQISDVIEDLKIVANNLQE